MIPQSYVLASTAVILTGIVSFTAAGALAYILLLSVNLQPRWARAYLLTFLLLSASNVRRLLEQSAYSPQRLASWLTPFAVAEAQSALGAVVGCFLAQLLLQRGNVLPPSRVGPHLSCASADTRRRRQGLLLCLKLWGVIAMVLIFLPLAAPALGPIAILALSYYYMLPSRLVGQPHFMAGIGVGPNDLIGVLLAAGYYAVIAFLIAPMMWCIARLYRRNAPSRPLPPSPNSALAPDAQTDARG